MTRSPATRNVRAGSSLLFVAAVVVTLAGTLAGCDDAPSPSAGTPGPGGTAGTTGAPPGTTSPVESPAGEVKLPPGAQFARGVTSIPGEAEPVVTQFLTRAYFFSMRDGKAEALYRDGSEWTSTVIDDGGYKPPSGSSLDRPFDVVAAAANDRTMVVLGASTTTDKDRPNGLERLPESIIWVTTDGKAFTSVNPRDVVEDAAVIRLTGIAATSQGFVAVGDVLPGGFDGPAGIVVLESKDGEHWSVLQRLTGQGTLHVRALLAERDLLVIDATDQWCDGSGISFAYGLRTGSTVVWVSPDGGRSWSAVDLAGAAPVVSQAAALIEGCPPNLKLADVIALSQDLDTEGAIVGLAGGVLVARSRDGTTIGLGAGTAWSQSALPDAIPIAEDGRRPYAQAVVRDASGAIRSEGTFALLSLEDRADLEGRPKSGGCQVRWWRTEDGGTTWSSGPLGRPFPTCAGATWSFTQLLDGSVLLFANDIIANTNRGQASFRTGTPGDLIEWETCSPGPNVDCSFATITNPTSEAPDWPGINLSGATVTGAAIPGVQMPKANAYAALLSGTFGAADLREALLSYATLEGDFRGVDLHGAYLFNAIVGADLTGANLDGAELFNLTFDEGAICPDGKAPTTGATDAKAACRL